MMTDYATQGGIFILLLFYVTLNNKTRGVVREALLPFFWRSKNSF